MKLYVKDGNKVKLCFKKSLEFTNLEEFVSGLSKATGHYVCTLKYRLIVKGKTYLGETVVDTYEEEFKNSIDEKSPYKVILTNWNDLKSEKGYIEFKIEKNK